MVGVSMCKILSFGKYYKVKNNSCEKNIGYFFLTGIYKLFLQTANYTVFFLANSLNQELSVRYC